MTGGPVTATLAAKRNKAWEWVFVCIGCGLLSSSSRSDAMVCGAACRVRAHRSGANAQRLRLAREFRFVDERTGRPLPAHMGHIDAVCALRPDLRACLERGQVTVYQAMPEVHAAFIQQLFADLDARPVTTGTAP